MLTLTVTLSEGEEKALRAYIVSLQVWLDNAIHNKARQCIDRVVKEHSDKQPEKLSRPEKEAIVRDAAIKTAAERVAEELPLAAIEGAMNRPRRLGN